MRELHEAWGWVLIGSNLVVAVWALVAHTRPAVRSPWLWRATAVAQSTAFVQAALGVWIINDEDLEPPQFHVFYGFLTIITVGILYSYRHQLAHRIHLLYGFGGLFLVGLGLRAYLMGPV